MIGELEVSLMFGPSTRTLSPASPSLQWVAWASLPHLPDRSGLRPERRPSVLCSAKTSNIPSRQASVVPRLPIPLSHPVLFALGRGGWPPNAEPGGSLTRVSTFRFFVEEKVGSPKFPGFPIWMHAPLSEPGGASKAPPLALKTAAFHELQGVG